MSGYKNFIFFHPKTTGMQDGRAVFIDPNLLPRFIDLVDIDSAEGKRTASKLIELRGAAGGITADSNLKTAGVHREVMGVVEVLYEVVQQGGAENRGAGVYIKKIRRANGNSGSAALPAGFYQSDYKRTEWALTPIMDEAIPTAVGAIGAVFDETAYDALSTAKEYGEYFQTSGKVSHKLLNNSFSLYYAPSFVVDELGGWETKSQKLLGPNAGPGELARILNKAERSWDERDQTIKYHWYVFKEGAKILHRALKIFKQKAGGKKLQQHCFYFVNPRENLGLLMQEVEAIGAQTKKTSYEHEMVDDIASKVHQIKDSSCAVRGLQKVADAPWTRFDTDLQKCSRYYQDKLIAGGDSNRTFADAVNYVRSEFKSGWGD
ncbi:hypothetical protein [Microbulbifer sp. SSSA005]|uniref:hypothetical protein n=1 Tax=Microbulbifer sp. SSSA005 TaxID=3243378 RepID=UPI004039C689